MDNALTPNGTCLQGYINAPYKAIVAVFGKPNADGDDYKTDANWIGSINGQVFTLYNYKDGKNYNGRCGLPISKLTDWHIGAHEKYVAEELVQFFNSRKVAL
jgi:hypothetical protein